MSTKKVASKNFFGQAPLIDPPHHPELKDPERFNEPPRCLLDHLEKLYLENQRGVGRDTA